MAVDGSDNSRAARAAVELAKRFNSRLIVLNVITRRASLLIQSYPMAPPPPQKERDAYYRYLREAAAAIVGETVSLAKEHEVQARPEVLEVSSSVVRGITDYAFNEKVDLIVMGTRGRGASRGC